MIALSGLKLGALLKIDPWNNYACMHVETTLNRLPARAKRAEYPRACLAGRGASDISGGDATRQAPGFTTRHPKMGGGRI